jgi:hypothetical protein
VDKAVDAVVAPVFDFDTGGGTTEDCLLIYISFNINNCNVYCFKPFTRQKQFIFERKFYI